MSRTVAQQTNEDGFPKAAEVIEISGAHQLEAVDRAVLNTLYQHAHDSGRLGEPDAEFEIPLARLRPSKHESNDRMLDILIRLRRVVVTIPYIGAPNADYPDGEPRVIVTGLFSFFDLARHEKTLPSLVRYGLPKKLQPIIARSGRWGRIKAEVVCAMTSKYAIALYELIQLRANLHRKCAETFPIDQFRALMGVPPGKLLRGADFVRWVLEAAALEVNGLSDMCVTLEAVRRSSRAPITAVRVEWRDKKHHEQRAAALELRRPKVGRMARLKGTVEQVTPAPLDAGRERRHRTFAKRVVEAADGGPPIRIPEVRGAVERVVPTPLTPEEEKAAARAKAPAATAASPLFHEEWRQKLAERAERARTTGKTIFDD